MSQLLRQLTVRDAVGIGLASMLGAGVFSVWGPAAASAGYFLLIGLVLAAFVAWTNAKSAAQLSAQYPESGGAYTYGRRRLGKWVGFVAGWSFVIGKTASIAAMAMVFSAYLVPDEWQKLVAIAVLWVLIGVNLLGVSRTAKTAKILVGIALAGIVIALIAGWVVPPTLETSLPIYPSIYGVLQSAGLIFFAFAGYARIATMGEEVIDPERSIPKAIFTALTAVLVIYAVIAVTLLIRVGPNYLAASNAPLSLLTEGYPALRVVLAIAAAAASAGALLGLLPGVSRTWLAMSRTGDLPEWFNHVGEKYKTPHRIELTLGVVLTGIIAVIDLRGAIGFSSFGVLVYYFVMNLAAWSQEGEHRRTHEGWQIAGVVLTALLALTLPAPSVAFGIIIISLGIVWRAAKPAETLR